MKTFTTIFAATLLLMGSVTSAHAGSCPGDLPGTLGYWKTHTDAWPVEYVLVGNDQLGMDYIIDNIAYLDATPQGDAVVILLHQLIAAKLNIAAGVNGAPVSGYIDEADALLAEYWIGDDMDEFTRDKMIDLAERLDEFNNGAYCELPVELMSFEAQADGTTIHLAWTTASETNNSGFEVEHRRGDGFSFERVAFVDGYGTTNFENTYSLSLSDLGYGHHTFRLKQIDLDGTFSYSGAIEVDASLTSSFALTEAYPNPFNPSTTIRFSLREAGFVTLGVYDMTGRLVRTLTSGSFDAGSHDVTFRADNLPSGTYLYRLQTAAGPVTGSIVLLK